MVVFCVFFGYGVQIHDFQDLDGSGGLRVAAQGSCIIPGCPKEFSDMFSLVFSPGNVFFRQSSMQNLENHSKSSKYLENLRKSSILNENWEKYMKIIIFHENICFWYFPEIRFTFGTRWMGIIKNDRLQMSFSGVSLRARYPTKSRHQELINQISGYKVTAIWSRLIFGNSK